MNSDQFEGMWKQLKGSAKQRWAKLTDDDLTAISGKRDELLGKLQQRYGYTREQAEKEADDWSRASTAGIDALDDRTDAALGTHAGRRK